MWMLARERKHKDNNNSKFILKVLAIQRWGYGNANHCSVCNL